MRSPWCPILVKNHVGEWELGISTDQQGNVMSKDEGQRICRVCLECPLTVCVYDRQNKQKKEKE